MLVNLYNTCRRPSSVHTVAGICRSTPFSSLRKFNDVELAGELFDLFSKHQERSSTLNRFLDDALPGMNLRNAFNVLRLGGKSGVKLTSTHIKQLTAIINRHEVVPPDESKIFSGLLYGLKVYPEYYDEIPALLAAIRSKLEDGVSSLESQFFGNALYGLQHMSSKEPEVLAIVDTITRKLYLSRGDLDAQAIGNALYGLMSMDNDSKEVNSLLLALSMKLQSTPDILEARHVANALYGLQRMRHVTPELEALWAQLADHLGRCTGRLTAQNVGSAYAAFSGLTSFDSPALKALLAKLNTILLNFPKGELDEQAIAAVLQGLSGADDGPREVRSALRCLAPHVQLCRGRFTDAQTRRIVRSLSGFSSESPEVRGLIKTLAYRLTRVPDLKLLHSWLPGMVWALRDLGSDRREVQALLAALLKALPPPSKEQKIEKRSFVFRGSEMAWLLGGLRSVSPASEAGRLFIERILALIGPVTRAPPGVVDWDTAASEVFVAMGAIHGKRLGDESVLELLSLVTALVRRCPAPASDFDSDALILSLRCLKSLLVPPFMSAHLESVHQLLAVMNPKIIDGMKAAKSDLGAGTRLTHSELGEVFSGLRGLSCSNGHVQTFLRAMKTCLRHMDCAVDPLSLCKYVSAMALMDWCNPAVSSFLAQLTKHQTDDESPTQSGGASALEAEADLGGILVSAAQGCRRLSAATPAGAVILREMAMVARGAAARAAPIAADPAALCAALAGLRGFADSLLIAEDSQQRRTNLEHVQQIAEVLLQAVVALDGPTVKLTPLQYGAVLLTTVDYLPLFASSNSEVDSLLSNLEAIAGRGHAALCDWQAQAAEEGAAAAGEGAVVSKKRPAVTRSDLVLLRQALHVALQTIDKVLSDNLASGRTVTEEAMSRLRSTCVESLAVADAKHFSAEAPPADDEEEPAEQPPLSTGIAMPGLTYAEMKHTKTRRHFRNYLAKGCLERNRHVVVTKVNPSLLGTFSTSTDIVLAVDGGGADLSRAPVSMASLPYHHLLNPSLFPLYTDGNSESIINVILDVETKDKIYSSPCGVDSQLMRQLKKHFLKRVLGEDQVGQIWNPSEQKEHERSKISGAIQLPPEELLKKKLIYYNLPLDDFEDLRAPDTLTCVLAALGLPDEPKPVVEEGDKQNTPDHS